MPVKICSFCGSLIQEGEMHRLEDFLETVDNSERKAQIDKLIRDLANVYKADIISICTACFNRYTKRVYRYFPEE